MQCSGQHACMRLLAPACLLHQLATPRNGAHRHMLRPAAGAWRLARRHTWQPDTPLTHAPVPMHAQAGVGRVGQPKGQAHVYSRTYPRTVPTAVTNPQRQMHTWTPPPHTHTADATATDDVACHAAPRCASCIASVPAVHWRCAAQPPEHRRHLGEGCRRRPPALIASAQACSTTGQRATPHATAVLAGLGVP